MTFEERLDRLTERHEALTQSLELLAGMQRDNERRHAELTEETNRRFEETNRQIADVLQFINQLAHVAEAHERRLDRLDEK